MIMLFILFSIQFLKGQTVRSYIVYGLSAGDGLRKQSRSKVGALWTPGIKTEIADRENLNHENRPLFHDNPQTLSSSPVNHRQFHLSAVMFSRQVIRSVRAAAPQRAIAVRSTPVRNYAAAAAASDGQPPISVFGVDGTYASALVRTFSE